MIFEKAKAEAKAKEAERQKRWKGRKVEMRKGESPL